MFPHGRRFSARSLVIALAGAAFLALILAPVASTASARPPSVPNPSPIKHIVVLYLENHSFDNVLGYWCKARPGRCQLPGGAYGGMPSSVKLSNGVVVTPGVTPDLVPNVDHSVQAQQLAIDGGKMDGWQKIKGCMKPNYACISGYKPSHIPNATALASDFAISDDTFSMADSPSWGGHLYAVAANLDHFTGNNPVPFAGKTPHAGWGCNSNRIAPWVSPQGITEMIPSCIPDFSLGLKNGGAFRRTPAANIPTIMDRLQAKGLTWRIYGQPTQPASAKGNAKGYGWDICPSFAECLDTSQTKHNIPASEFVNDASSGNLPDFAVVTPGGTEFANSQHNGMSMTAGDNWIGQVATAIMTGRAWKSTALFITWDDCGCFYDQVPTRKNPDTTQRGPRSPLIIVSPFARPGYTDTTATTFAGILAFVEHNFKLTALAANDKNAYWFQNAFNFAQTPLGPVRMVTRPVPPGEHIDMAEANQDT